jgi:uncharacterized lipoprotein YajG
MKKFSTLILSFILSSCASVNSVSLTPIPADRHQPIKVEASKVIVLGLNFDNDFVDQLVSDLQRKCPKGKVTGILTKDENINYFLYLVWKKQVTATGYCVSNATAGNNSTSSKRGTASVNDEDSLDQELAQ